MAIKSQIIMGSRRDHILTINYSLEGKEKL